ncbi:hypothetical protein D3C72_784320 [compost metagenome]
MDKHRLGMGCLYLGEGQLQGVLQVVHQLALHRNPATQTSSGKVEDVFDQHAHAHRAVANRRNQVERTLVFGFAFQQVGAHAHRAQWCAQVVAENGDELLAQAPEFIGVVQLDLGRFQMALRVQVHGDQLSEQGQCFGDGRFVDIGRDRVDGAQRAEEVAIGFDDGNGDVAFQPIGFRRVVQRKDRVRAGVPEDHRLLMLADLVADGRFKYQFATGFEPEINGVIDSACHPVAFGDPCDRSEPHAREVFDHAQDDWHRVNAADRVNIRGKGRIGHGAMLREEFAQRLTVIAAHD